MINHGQKIEDTRHPRVLIQIIDMSHKIYYLDMKQQEHLYTMANAMVSHELRNPLNSLLNQLDYAKTLRQQLKALILKLGHSKSSGAATIQIDDILPRLRSIEQNICQCFLKIQNSGKFIKFFVHDILDFSILKQDGDKFVKNIAVFDIRDSIQEILEIQEDKIAMKNIKVETEFVGFPVILNEGQMSPYFYVKSDQKRLQQVFLNLYSNAIKYTDRGGLIQITTEFRTNAEADSIHISVKDNGLGIKRED